MSEDLEDSGDEERLKAVCAAAVAAAETAVEDGLFVEEWTAAVLAAIHAELAATNAELAAIKAATAGAAPEGELLNQAIEEAWQAASPAARPLAANCRPMPMRSLSPEGHLLAQLRRRALAQADAKAKAESAAARAAARAARQEAKALVLAQKPKQRKLPVITPQLLGQIETALTVERKSLAEVGSWFGISKQRLHQVLSSVGTSADIARWHEKQLAAAYAGLTELAEAELEAGRYLPAAEAAKRCNAVEGHYRLSTHEAGGALREAGLLGNGARSRAQRNSYLGKTFGDWIVVGWPSEELPVSEQDPLCRCQACGTTRPVRLRHLNAGLTRGCGCRSKTSGGRVRRFWTDVESGEIFGSAATAAAHLGVTALIVQKAVNRRLQALDEAKAKTEAAAGGSTAGSEAAAGGGLDGVVTLSRNGKTIKTDLLKDFEAWN